MTLGSESNKERERTATRQEPKRSAEGRKNTKAKTTHRFLKRAMLKHPPHARVRAQALPKVEERADRQPASLQRTRNVRRHARAPVLVGLQQHDAVPEVAAQEQVLAGDARRRGEERGEGAAVARQAGREGRVGGVELREQRGFVPRRGGEWPGERARHADRRLHDVGQPPH